jgi:FkbM family methyltransferase
MSVAEQISELSLRLQRLPERIRLVVAARRRAKTLGFEFVRALGFSLPQQIVINKVNVTIRSPNDGGSVTDFIGVFLHDGYALERITSMADPVRSIVDIGANVGWFSLAARATNPSAQIAAYEPNREVIPFLEGHTERLNIRIFAEAVGAKEGFVSLTSGVPSNQVRVVGHGEVPKVSLRTVLERAGGTIDILKIDCEGAEWEMFDDQEPWRNIEWVTMEYHLWAKPGATHEHVPSIMQQLGYHVLCQKPDQEWGLLLARRHR